LKQEFTSVHGGLPTWRDRERDRFKLKLSRSGQFGPPGMSRRGAGMHFRRPPSAKHDPGHSPGGVCVRCGFTKSRIDSGR
jgi:hypothetical protein